MNSRNSKTRNPRWIATAERIARVPALVSFLLLTAIACSWSQDARSRQRVVSAASPPFAEVNESIARTANAVLASVTQSDSDAGASNPADASAAEFAIRHYAQSISGLDASLKNARSRLASLRPVIEPILREAGIPTNLAAVVLVESGGDRLALSPKGARGLWQLMPETARRYGLIVDTTEDDRLDIEKSTRAAAHYLSDLYFEFGSWPLALAAYNTGEQNLQHAIDRSRSSDFNVLSSLRLLPLETRNYVPAVLAAETQLTNSPPGAQIPLRQKQSAGIVLATTERSY